MATYRVFYSSIISYSVMEIKSLSTYEGWSKRFAWPSSVYNKIKVVFASYSTVASDQLSIDVFGLRRSKRCGYCHPDPPTLSELLEESDDRRFTNSLPVVTLDIHYTTFSHHPPRHHNTTTSTVHQHITDNYQHAQATSLTATSSHAYCIKIVTELFCQCDYLRTVFYYAYLYCNGGAFCHSWF